MCCLPTRAKFIFSWHFSTFEQNASAANVLTLKNALSSEKWVEGYNKHDANEAYNEFVKIFTYNLDLVCPKVKCLVKEKQVKSRTWDKEVE